MVIGSKWQLKLLNRDDFTISVDSDKLLLAKQAKYLGLWARSDLSWDDHILELCREMYYYFHMFHRLRKILPSALLLNIYKTYVQSKIDYVYCLFGVVQRKSTSIVYNESRICLQESYVITLIIYTREVLI